MYVLTYICNTKCTGTYVIDYKSCVPSDQMYSSKFLERLKSRKNKPNFISNAVNSSFPQNLKKDTTQNQMHGDADTAAQNVCSA